MPNTEEQYSIYHFADPRDNEEIYIGLTNNPDRRYREHTSKSGLLYPLVQELAKEGLRLIFGILETTQGIDNAYAAEKKQIRQHKPLLNILNNAIAVGERKATKQYIEDISIFMESYGFTYEQAIIFHKAFYASEGDFYTYQTIKSAVMAAAKYLQSNRVLSEPEILEIALKATGFYEKWESMWGPLMKSLKMKGGMEGE